MYHDAIREILAKAEAIGMLGATSTLNKIYDVLAPIYGENNADSMDQYLRRIECLGNRSNNLSARLRAGLSK